MKNLKFHNLYKLDLSDSEAVKVEKDSKGKVRALLVDLEVSASGRVTNGRIYPPKGHQDGLGTWTSPYEKPVQVHHDDLKDPIGRFKKAVWVDTEQEALEFLGGNRQALSEIKNAFNTRDGKLIRKTLQKYNALDRKWPGLGRVVGSVRITDEDAIQKFSDGRYLTWSAGQSTDAFICMSCNEDWKQGSICDHEMGGVDEDGQPVIFLCGTMSGEEVSVVNRPGNDRSVTLSMKFEDSAREDISETMKLEDADVIKPVVRLEDEEIVEAAPTKLHLSDEDMNLLVSKLAELLKKEPIHAAEVPEVTHTTSENNPADDSQVEANGEPVPEPVASGEPEAGAGDSTATTEPEGGSEGSASTGETPAREPDREASELESIDWELLNLGLVGILGDKAVPSEDIIALEDSSFCGPGRLFPLVNEQYVLSAKKLIGKLKVDDTTRMALVSLVDTKAVELDIQVNTVNVDELTADYANALLQVDSLKDKLLSVLKALRGKHEPNFSIEDSKLDELEEWFATLGATVETTTAVLDEARPLKAVEDPNVSTLKDNQHTVNSADALPRFLKSVVDKYSRILTSKDGGKQFAESYLYTMRDLLPAKFDIKQYVPNSDTGE